VKALRRAKAGLACLAALAAALLARAATAGPTEARLLWRAAEDASWAPWPVRVRAYRAVRAVTSPTDPIVARAAAAEASVLRGAGHAAGAAAADALAAALGPTHDGRRLGHALEAAREMLSDGDVAAAVRELETIVAQGGGGEPDTTAPALDLLASAAADRGDAKAVEAIAKRAEGLVPRRLVERLRIHDRLGVLRLDAGDERAARRVLADMTRLFDDSRRGEDEAQRAVAKAWLKLTLPRRLDDLDRR
jgi:hypothetical protein